MKDISAFDVSFVEAQALSLKQLNGFNNLVFANRFSLEFRFPVRYKITEDDKVPNSDHPNKFDIDNMNISM